MKKSINPFMSGTPCSKNAQHFLESQVLLQEAIGIGDAVDDVSDHRLHRQHFMTIFNNREQLPLLVVIPQGTALLLSSRLHSAVKHCSSEVLVSSGAAGKGSGPKRLVKYRSGMR